MKDASTIEAKAAEVPQIRIKLRTGGLGILSHLDRPRMIGGGEPFVIRLKNRALRAADDASLATQFAV